MLTEQQKQFAKFIIEGHLPQDAAIKAGYSPRSVANQTCRLMANDEVMIMIDESREGAIEKSELTAAFVLNGLMENAREARDANQYSASTTAYGLLGKHLALFIDRSEVTVTGETMQFLEAVIGIIDQEVQDMDTRIAIVKRLSKLQESLND